MLAGKASRQYNMAAAGRVCDMPKGDGVGEKWPGQAGFGAMGYAGQRRRKVK
jgi:hypothetical protein